jgi:hypothetical protein
VDESRGSGHNSGSDSSLNPEEWVKVAEQWTVKQAMKEDHEEQEHK